MICTWVDTRHTHTLHTHTHVMFMSSITAVLWDLKCRLDAMACQYSDQRDQWQCAASLKRHYKTVRYESYHMMTHMHVLFARAIQVATQCLVTCLGTHEQHDSTQGEIRTLAVCVDMQMPRTHSRPCLCHKKKEIYLCPDVLMNSYHICIHVRCLCMYGRLTRHVLTRLPVQERVFPNIASPTTGLSS